MRGSASPAPLIFPNSADTSRGTNQSGVKLYNKSLVLAPVRRYGSLSKAEIGRRTGLSTETSSVIMKQLEDDGLLIRKEPMRGKVGQPSIPMSLNPEGAFSIGFKFGRRSAELVLMDFIGTARRLVRTTYAYPAPKALEQFIRSDVAEVTTELSRQQRGRICRLGIATPSKMWGWEEELGPPHEALEAWRAYDIRTSVERLVPWPVHFCNDATAAGGAELAFGSGAVYANFLYVFIATLIGGGVVLNGSLYPGRTGYAGAFGSILVPDPSDDRAPQSLIRCASLYLLENMMRSEGKDPSILWRSSDDWSEAGSTLDGWIERATDSLTVAIVSAISVIDFEAIVIDGAFPRSVRSAIVEKTCEQFGRM